MSRPINTQKQPVGLLRGGFTLTELMIAAFLTLIVVSIGGWGIAAILTASKTNESQNERRGELNRSLEFMATEVRQSTHINSVASDPSDFSPPSSEVTSGTVQTVLRLSIQGLPTPVLYYVATPAASNLTWRGPKVIYRWGPDFDADGGYINASNPSAWMHKPLIDAIDDQTATVTCPTSWTLSPASGAAGFYACIDDKNRIAQIFNNGRITKVLGERQSYLASAQVFTRSAVSGASLGGLPFSRNNNQIILSTPATMTVQILGSAIACSGDPVMKTQLVINKEFNGATTSTQPIVIDPAISMPTIPAYSNESAGTTFNFTGKIPTANNPNNTCNAQDVSGEGFNSVANPQQVVILVDGEMAPTLQGLAGQKSVEQYIKNYVDSSGKITLPDPQHQYIVLFELGTTDSGTSAYDLQDIVLLGSVTPS
jgi:type II secretory pathway pseudopilin PulG